MSPLESIESAPFIRLEDITTRARDVSGLGKQLLARMGDALFSYYTMTEIVFHALKQIAPINEELILDRDSVEQACSKFIEHIFNGKRKKYKITIDGVEPKRESSPKSDFDLFCEIVLFMNQAPGPLYSLLLMQVNDDLRSISELIKHYELQPCIKSYLSDDKVPTTHQERTTYDFYKRCIAERIKILNYQLNGLKERALEKARPMGMLFPGLSFFNMWSDRPYQYALPFSEHYFDSSKISQSRHRVAEISIDESDAMQELYERDKAAFYEQYFAKTSVEQHFISIQYHLSLLPVSVGKRKPIFEELRKLFEEKHWIGFYALALPQIEGLFSEMCRIVSTKDFSYKALPAKVKEVRPYHSLSESYFDYYEYYIPLQRNRFAHYGYDEDFEIKAFDMLVDINHLLKVFYELENPYVELTRLHKRRDYTKFITIQEFSHYFSLHDRLAPNQRAEIWPESQLFEKEFLIQECSLEYLCYQMQQDLPQKIMAFLTQFDYHLGEKNPEPNILSLNKADMETFVEAIDTDLLEKVDDVFTMLNHEFELLQGYYHFIEKSKKHLPSLNKDLKALLSSLKSEFGEDLKRLSLLRMAVMDHRLPFLTGPSI